MSVPALATAWNYVRNSSFSTTGGKQADYQQNVRALKDTLKTLGWTVVGSSNGVAAGLDGVDRWSANADIVWGASGSAHSWIVMRMGGFSAANSFEILISTRGSFATSYEQIGILAAWDVDFSGGSTTADPTSANSQNILGFQTTWLGNFTTASTAWQGLGSTDGKAYRLACYISNVPVFWLIVENPININASWTTEAAKVVIGAATSGSGNVDQLTTSILTTSGNYKSRINGSNRNCAPTALSPPSSVAATFYADSSMSPDALSSAFMVNQFLMCITATVFAFLGGMRDMWLVQTGTLVEGDYQADAGGNRQLIVMGNLLLPWESASQLATPTNQAGTSRTFDQINPSSATVSAGGGRRFIQGPGRAPGSPFPGSMF